MKTTITAIFAIAGAATVAAVDFPSNMPDCGENDIACLCRNKDFGFGIHDCTIQVCDSVDQANVAIDWGNSLCAGVNVPANIPSATSVAGPTGGSSSGGSEASSAPVTSESSESGEASAITTSTWTSTLSNNSGTTTTVIGETTITGTGGAGGATSAVESTVTSPIVSTRTDVTSVSEPSPTTNGAQAPQMTAAPALGALAAAGIAFAFF
ncbi:hypothetical protein L209DRAFT_403641 [Thermothelomyces heterothallicus CBS 203.75]